MAPPANLPVPDAVSWVALERASIDISGRVQLAGNDRRCRPAGNANAALNAAAGPLNPRNEALETRQIHRLKPSFEREHRIGRQSRGAAAQYKPAPEPFRRVNREFEWRHLQSVARDYDWFTRRLQGQLLAASRHDRGPGKKADTRRRQRIERKFVDEELAPKLTADCGCDRVCRRLAAAIARNQDANNVAEVQISETDAPGHSGRSGTGDDDIPQVNLVAEEVATDGPFAVRCYVRQVRLLVKRRSDRSPTSRSPNALLLLGQPMRHSQVESRVAQGHVTNARTRHIELGPRNEAWIGLKIVEIARKMGHPRYAALNLGREATQPIHVRQRDVVYHDVGGEGATPADRDRPEHGAGGTQPSPAVGRHLVKRERAQIDVSARDATLPIEPPYGQFRGSLGKSLAIKHNVFQTPFRVHSDVAAAARVLRTIERHMNVRTHTYRGVQAVKTRVVVEREHRQQIAKPECVARPDGIDYEPARAAEPQHGRWHFVGAGAFLSANPRNRELRLGHIHFNVPCAHVAKGNVRDDQADRRLNIALRLGMIEDAAHVGACRKDTMDRHRTDGRDVVEVSPKMRDVDAQVVVEADGHEGAVDLRAGKSCADVNEFDGVGTDA